MIFDSNVVMKNGAVLRAVDFGRENKNSSSSVHGGRAAALLHVVQCGAACKVHPRLNRIKKTTFIDAVLCN